MEKLVKEFSSMMEESVLKKNGISVTIVHGESKLSVMGIVPVSYIMGPDLSLECEEDVFVHIKNVNMVEKIAEITGIETVFNVFSCDGTKCQIGFVH